MAAKPKTPAPAGSDDQTTKDLVVAKETALSTEVNDLDELTQAGQEFKETLGKDDMSIPFIQILQQLSPQCTKGQPEYIKGAESGELFNTVTSQRWSTRDDDDQPIVGMRILPITYKRTFIEWVPRNKGGGLVKEWDVDQGLAIVTARNENNQDIIQQGSPYGTPGNQLNDTHTHFVFVIREDGTYFPAVLAMSSTQIKPSKNLNSMIADQKLSNGAQAPRFFAIWNVTTDQRTNDQGSWYIWKFEKAGDVQSLGMMPMFREAKAFAASVLAGEHKVDHSKIAGDVNPSTADAGKGADDEVPF